MFTSIILAAGKGTRMKSKQPKALAKLLFRPMIDWVVESGRNAGARDICVVVGHGKEDVMKHLEGQCTFANQDQQLGTGHAIMQ